MNDAVEPTPPTDEPAQRQRGPRRRTAFGLGTLVGIGLGIAAIGTAGAVVYRLLT